MIDQNSLQMEIVCRTVKFIPFSYPCLTLNQCTDMSSPKKVQTVLARVRFVYAYENCTCAEMAPFLFPRPGYIMLLISDILGRIRIGNEELEVSNNLTTIVL